MITPALFGDHPAGGQACGQEVRHRIRRDRQRELLGTQLDQRHADDLRIRDPDGVERDIDTTGFLDHRLEMIVHSLLVESVDRRRLGGSAGVKNVPGDRIDRFREAPGDEQPGAFAGCGACDSTSDRTSASIDHDDLVLQHHLRAPLAGYR